jgi:Zn-dependent peptidase ImmA (M78 family)
MYNIYQAFDKFGINKNYMREKILPEWWKDEIADNPLGYQEALFIISRNLRLNFKELCKSPINIVSENLGRTKLKKRNDVEEKDIDLNKRIALRAAEIVDNAFSGEYKKPSTALEIRRSILERVSHISLKALLDYCWDIGIPVLHISDLPDKRMDGMTASINGKPVIILSNNRRYSSWLVFILAHELGHVACGHLENVEILIDIDEDIESNGKDIEEREASQFAVELLTGHSETIFESEKYLTGEELAEESIRLGNKLNIAPGVIALNYAYNADLFAVGMKALGILEPDDNASRVVNKMLVENLDVEKIPEDGLDFLENMLTIEF